MKTVYQKNLLMKSFFSPIIVLKKSNRQPDVQTNANRKYLPAPGEHFIVDMDSSDHSLKIGRETK